MSPRTRFPEVALFDLDGTLLDSAPDMLATVNVMRERHGIAPMMLAEIRPVVSRGARAMAGTAFPEWNDEEILAAVPEFLAIYAQELGRQDETRPILEGDVEGTAVLRQADFGRPG